MRRRRESGSGLILKVVAGLVAAFGLFNLLGDLDVLQLSKTWEKWLEGYLSLFRPVSEFLFGWIFSLFAVFGIHLPELLKHYFFFGAIIGGSISSSVVAPPHYRLLGHTRFPASGGRIVRATVREHVVGQLKRIFLGTPLYFPMALIVAPFVLVMASMSAIGFRNYFAPHIQIILDSVILAITFLMLAVLANHIWLQFEGP